MQQYFKTEIKVVYAINGTASNILALKSMLDRYSTVLCEEQTHINTHECGAVEAMLGNKILAMKGQALQHMDKSKFLGAQMECLLEKDL